MSWSVRPVDVVLGTLPVDLRAVAEQLIRADPEFRAEVERLRVVRDALRTMPAEGWAPEPAPAVDAAEVLAARREPAAGPGVGGDGSGAGRRVRGEHRRRGRDGLAARRGGRARALGGALVQRPATALGLAAVLLGGGLAAGVALERTPRAQDPPGARVALRALGGGAQRAEVRLPAAPGGSIDLRVADAAPSKPGEHYELWLLDDAEHLTSVGTFRVGADGAAHGRFDVGVPPRGRRVLDVSLERDDGNPAHSRRSVLRSGALS